MSSAGGVSTRNQIGGSIIIFVVLILQLRYGIMPDIWFVGIIGIILIFIVFKLYERLTEKQRMERNREIKAREAKEHINEYLEEDSGKFPINENIPEAIHEDTIKLDLDGEKQKIYAITGYELNVGENTPNVIRVVWNLSENDLVKYDGEASGDVWGEPLLGIEEYLRQEGYRIRERRRESDRKNSADINFNVKSGGQNE